MCCNNKRLLKNMAIDCGQVGVCNECLKSIKPTKGEGAFEGTEFLSYLIAPLYYNGKTRKLIKNLKFYGEFKSAEVLYEIFKSLPEETPHLLDFDMVIPVPLSRQRDNERGYNQAELIAKSIADVFPPGFNKELRNTFYFVADECLCSFYIVFGVFVLRIEF